MQRPFPSPGFCTVCCASLGPLPTSCCGWQLLSIESQRKQQPLRGFLESFFVCLFKLKAGTGRAPPHPRRLCTPILFRFPPVVATRHCPPWGLYPICLCRKRTLIKFQGNDPSSPPLSFSHHRASHSASWSQGPLAPPARSQSLLPVGFS